VYEIKKLKKIINGEKFNVPLGGVDQDKNKYIFNNFYRWFVRGRGIPGQINMY